MVVNPSQTSLEADVSMEKEAVEIAEDPPFHILVLGDFSGGGSKGRSLKPFQIDRDEFETVMGLIAPTVEIPAAESGSLALTFKGLDDFHPDTLFRSVSLFDQLRAIRKKLQDEDSFNSAASEVRSWFDDDTAPPDTGEGVPGPEVESGEGLLEDILGSRTRDAAAYQAQESAHLKDFVKKVVDPFVVKVDEDEQSRLIEVVDDATGKLMNSILRDRAYRSLESLWRGLHFVCRRVETSTKLKIFVLDITKEGFLEGLKDKELSGISDVLLGHSTGAGSEPWAVIASTFDFDLNVDDVAALLRAGATAGVTGAAFVSHIRPSMLGFRSFAEQPDPANWDTESDSNEAKLWTAMRGSPEGQSIGLITPRLLSRLPYGAATDPTEVFSFEEFEGEPNHDDYLWMNPVFGFAVIIGTTFAKYGWEMGGRYELDLPGLPVHVYQNESGTSTKPCAEIEMTDAGLDLLLGEGLMPFASFKDTDRVRLGGVQSVSFPQKSLKGRWR